jgi:NAD(P)-dependent dehydrogenase (short-subunit alcohol dehydrogenase family)
MSFPWNLQGKVAIVTGGNGGIGLGMAQGLAAAGATVVIAARNADKSTAAVATLVASGGVASGMRICVTRQGGSWGLRPASHLSSAIALPASGQPA